LAPAVAAGHETDIHERPHVPATLNPQATARQIHCLGSAGKEMRDLSKQRQPPGAQQAGFNARLHPRRSPAVIAVGATAGRGAKLKPLRRNNGRRKQEKQNRSNHG
jgi:hypothetical protein